MKLKLKVGIKETLSAIHHNYVVDNDGLFYYRVSNGFFELKFRISVLRSKIGSSDEEYDSLLRGLGILNTFGRAVRRECLLVYMRKR